MPVREYVYIKKGDELISQHNEFVSVDKIIAELKRKKLKGKIEIEYVVKIKDDLITYALFFINNYVKKGWVFPYAKNQSNKK